MTVNQKYFCHHTVIPVRADHKDQSEIVTQLVFGEVAELLEKHNQWRKIKIAHDGYEGWIDQKQIIKIKEEEFDFWSKNKQRQTAYLAKWSTKQGVFTSLRGANVPNNSKFIVGGMTFEQLTAYDHFVEKDISSIALSYLNAPYLWGGKTQFGIDCSGFTQTVYRFFGVELPRDAYQQAELGSAIGFEERKIGDIAYFHNADQKIIHVGILLEDDKFIHASGRVRIDQLSKEGIIHSENGQKTHNLTCLRRILQ
jgi:cell wall-associated NlpC family hydrolase